jgi:hypothetical protein
MVDLSIKLWRYLNNSEIFKSFQNVFISIFK